MTLADQFDGVTLDDIAQMIAQGQEEHLQLDFKTVRAAHIDRDDRKRLAKYLSGFANSSGGLVIWGVVARKNDHGVDCATASEEISPLGLFLTQLNNFTGQAVSPMVDGVRHRIIETAADRGYAITLVPESISGPHMAKLGEDRYWKRSGDSFYKMEHFDLEDMFGRRQKPDLQIIPALMEGLGDERERVTFRLLNTGRAMAKHVGFVAKFENATIANVLGVQDDTGLNNNRPTASYADDHSVVHPVAIARNVGWVAYKRLEKEKPVIIHVTWYCENMMSREATFQLPPPS